MAGYAARKEPARGIAQPLHAKALALEDAGGRRAGHRDPRRARPDRAGRRPYRRGRSGAGTGSRASGLLLCSSHTHSGPVIDDQLAVAYDLTPAQWDDVRASTRRIEDQVVDVIGLALGAMRPARLRWAQGTAGFGANRRTAFGPDGPVDPAVPVLSIERPDGTLAGLVFGYACHNTTLPASSCSFHGDYAGVAQAELERRHPGATALFVAGLRRRRQPAAARHDRARRAARRGSLADAVDRALGGAAEVRGRCGAPSPR